MAWKLLVEGDSYGLPRFAPCTDEVELSYEETYPERLRQRLLSGAAEDVVLVNHCRHANTTHSLICGEADELLFLEPDAVIIELGVTDLWPASCRKTAPLQPELSGKDPWVSLSEYQENLRRFAACAVSQRSRVILVSPPRISPGVLFRFPVAAERLPEYHAAGAALAASVGIEFLDWRAAMEQYPDWEMIGEDGIHPTAKASDLLAAALCCRLLEKGAF